MSTLTPVVDTPGAAPEPAPVPLGQYVELIWPGAEAPAAAALARRGILPCQVGQAIARVVELPVDTPRDPARVPMAEVRPGRFASWEAGRGVFVAQRKGHVRWGGGKIDVEEVLEFADDLDAGNGPVRYDGDVVLRQNVLDVAVLHVTGNLTIRGAVEAADLEAGHDLLVQRGICGKEKGRIRVGGSVTARFVTNAQIAAGGNIVVANEIANGRLSCGGELNIERGTILGGHVAAVGGIHCHSAGSPAGTKTILELGLGPEQYATLQRSLATAEASREKARAIRQAVQPLLACPKNLTPAQKEQATELLFTADEADMAGQTALATLQPLKEQLRASLGATLRVASVLHAGVIIRYPLAETCVAASIRGPVKITLSCRNGEVRILVAEEGRGGATPLPNIIPNDKGGLLHKLLNHDAPAAG